MLETLVLHNVIAAPHLAMVRRRSLEGLGGPTFDESLHGMEDADLWIRLAARGCRFAGIHDAVGTYRLHGGNASAPWAPDRARREESVRRHRHQILEADYFPRLPRGIRAECLRQCLLGAERGRPEGQEGVLTGRPFLDMPEREQARLLYLVGTENLVRDGDVARGRSRVLAAGRLSPRSARYRAAAALARVSPRALGAVLRLRRAIAAKLRGPDPSLAPHWTSGLRGRDPEGRGRP
jgi:hypothetical protein